LISSQMKKNLLRQRENNGFALIATILLMVLLAIITVGTLSLSVVTLRSSTQDTAQARARANARMALMIAIGELQRHTGSDTRITASANIVDESYPEVLGVWRSWEGTDHDTNGRPIAPQYSSKDQTESSGGRFVDWLVSTAAFNTTPSLNDPPSLVQTSVGNDTVPLLADGSLQDSDTRQIHVVPTELDDGGRFAWWVSGENQKARLGQPYEPRNTNAAGLVEMGQSHSIADPTVFGLSSLITDPEPYNPSTAPAKPGRKAVSRKTMALIAADNAVEPQKKFHDLSAYSIGLLTNTATGGWKKDLSILTEKWDDIYSSYPGGRLPLFRFTPDAGDTSLVTKPTLSNYTPDQSTLYPWSRHSLFSPQKWPNTWHAASSSWQSLVNFATSYKNFTYSNGVAKSPFVWSPVMKWRWQGNPNDATPRDFYDYNNTPRIHPVIARFQFIIYVRAYPDPIRPGRYGMEMIWSPVVTLWNPYNVRVSIDNPGPAGGFGLTIGSNRSFPGAFAAEPLAWFPGGPDTIPLNRYRMLNAGNLQYMDTNGNFGGAGHHDNTIPENMAKGYNMNTTRVNTWKDLRTWGLNFPTGEFALEPGEVRMFSPNANTGPAAFGSGSFVTSSGYPVGAPSGIPVTIRGGNESPNNFYWFSFKSDVETKPFRYRSAGRGFHVAFGYSDGATYQGSPYYTGCSKQTMSMTALTNADRAKVYWPDEDLEPHGYSVAEIASVPAMPLYSMTIGPRFTIGTGVGKSQSRPTKGFLQSDPLAGLSLVDPGVDNSNSHPANGNFEMSYNTLSFGSSITPNLSNREGFIVTGFQSGDGLSRLITHELPLRPMASLVELQAWNPRGKNPLPPYQSHLIGNSDASPMIPKADIVPSIMTPNNVTGNLQHDDAYCANHLLFDDFFLSSIAPRPVDFGNNIADDIETVYSDFLKGDAALTNRVYRPISEDTGLSDSEVSQLVTEIVNSPKGDGWMKIASRLEVDGMFNVNSTSIDAWKALLGHAQSISKLGTYGANGIGTVEPSTGNPLTRGVITTDVEAGNDPAIGGRLANAAEITGFRSLTDEQIEDLATKIVEQVRLRGPFLSLSEFVNRQLNDNENLAIAGAIQSAINNLENDPMSVLRDTGNFLSDETMASKAKSGSGNDSNRLNGVDYEFAKAAEGSSAYGMPGWIRQADVLRPIAPILSVRDDTFTIRAYGDSLDKNGNVVARAWCEATVQRRRDFIDSTDPADSIDGPTKEMNQKFGRKYKIVSFRWLNRSEV
jgi:type II secretory pathway pseudopilin PulG